MKLFWVKVASAKNMHSVLCVLLLTILSSCATLNPQYGTRNNFLTEAKTVDTSKILHTFFLVGDAGNADLDQYSKLQPLLLKRLQKADSSSTLLFLGDNIYPRGMPDSDDPGRKPAEDKISQQLNLATIFKGKTIFIPGNHDWYHGIEGLRRQEKFVNEFLKEKKSFLPRNGCGIDHLDIGENISMIVVDSEWYLQDWDDHPKVNEDCDIKSREQFFLELESELNKNQNKTVVLAIHHPLVSNGPHGGQYSLSKQIYPLKYHVPMPVIGSVINFLRKTSGLSPADLQNKKYNSLVKRIRTLIHDKENVIVVSGHEHNLQYLESFGVKQIVSGSASKKEAARAVGENDFSAGANGYAVLQILRSGEAKVAYYTHDDAGNEVLLYEHKPLTIQPKRANEAFPKKFDSKKEASVYTPKMTKKGAAYRFLWGKHYRKYYSTLIQARQVDLDTLYGGLKPTISGGGHQSNSLRLTDKDDKEYVMRALRKSATRFLQTTTFKDQAVEKDFTDTYAESFILDFYTTAHPYTPLVVPKLAAMAGIYHTNPKLFYVPKQDALGDYNGEFGDELYLIEERPTSESKNLKIFGRPSKIVGTDDVLVNLNDDEKYQIDEAEYIKARLFDMLIGDWDRHADQWRWSEFEENGKIIYRPIPRDRDQAFTKADGNLLRLIMNIPALRHMESYKPDIKNVKWFNRQGYSLDLRMLKKSSREDWIKQAAELEKDITDAGIDAAFEKLPTEIRDNTIDKIKASLKARRKNLKKYAKTYYGVLQKTVLIVGTEKKDRFEFSRAGKNTSVKVFRQKKDGEELQLERTYNASETNELWVYGLDGDDTFEVNGLGKGIIVRLIGGTNNDKYTIYDGKRVKIYDFKSAKNDLSQTNSARVELNDDYENNTFNYEKADYNALVGYPFLGYNPDDGVKVGAIVSYVVNGFNRNPFTQKHSIRGSYFFATSGFELSYKGTFPHTFGKWSLTTEALYTSPNFSVNFFGFGNETPNFDDEIDMDYNRVKISTLRIEPSLQWSGDQGAFAEARASFERLRVDETAGRFISEPGIINPNVFDEQNFADVSMKYGYENYDNPANPTLGMLFSVLGGYKINLEETDRQFPYAESALGFDYRLSKNKKWVLATLLKAKIIFSDEYEFYHAATLGGDTDLRGFRNQRFTGKRSFYQSTDIRCDLGKISNSFVPMRYGIFGGFDYGRLWFPQEFSEKWHQAYGGGVYINGINVLTAKLSYFSSTDGGRISFGLGVFF